MTAPPASRLPRIVPSPWSGWPSDWNTGWYGGAQVLEETAWTCIDLNASILSTMPPYLVGAAPSLAADWLINPNPDLYTGWDEFLKQVFWDYQAAGEVFVVADSFYATGWPARFHVVAPWYVQITLVDGLRRFTIGDADVTDRMLHIRYTSRVGPDVHGHGPLEVGAGRLVAAQILAQYATQMVAMGGIPTSVLEHPEELTAQQAADLQNQWVQARISSLGEPAVLSGGVTWKPTQMNPKDMGLLELAQYTQSRIAILLGRPAVHGRAPVRRRPADLQERREPVRPSLARRAPPEGRSGDDARCRGGRCRAAPASSSTVTPTSPRRRWSARRPRRSSTRSSTRSRNSPR